VTAAVEGCIFCRIVAGESPCERVFEDAATLAFMDIHPANEGHSLVIPKAHFEKIFDMPPEAFAAVGASVVRVARAVEEALQPGGLSIVQANGALAGQTVPHVHVHVLPRRADDRLPINWDRERTDPRAADPARLAMIAARLRERLQAAE
jgi:histidine triad (HIT) family protein